MCRFPLFLIHPGISRDKLGSCEPPTVCSLRLLPQPPCNPPLRRLTANPQLAELAGEQITGNPSMHRISLPLQFGWWLYINKLSDHWKIFLMYDRLCFDYVVKWGAISYSIYLVKPFSLGCLEDLVWLLISSNCMWPSLFFSPGLLWYYLLYVSADLVP